jgi:hypothetical protein
LLPSWVISIFHPKHFKKKADFLFYYRRFFLSGTTALAQHLALSNVMRAMQHSFTRKGLRDVDLVVAENQTHSKAKAFSFNRLGGATRL